MQRRARIGFAIAMAGVLLSSAPAVSAVAAPEAIAVWQQRAPGGDWDIWYATAARASADADPELSAGAPLARGVGDDENPQVAVPPGSTDALAMWQRSIQDGTHQIMWSRFADGGWSAAAAIDARGGDDVDPAVAFDDDGRALAVWVHRTPTRAALSWARFDGSEWSDPASIPGDIAHASIPELTFLSTPSSDGRGHRALLAFADRIDDDGEAVMRTRAARFDGVSWTAAETISLEADQRASLPEHGSADYTIPQGAFARLDVGAEADGDAVVVWGGPVAEDLASRHASAGLMGARLRAEGTWSAVRAPDGAALLGGAGCKAPAIAMTGSEDFVAAFTSDGFLEQQRIAREAPAVEGIAYNTIYDDVRPAIAPLADAMLVVATGLTIPEDGYAQPSVITWSLGTLRPPTETAGASVTFAAPKTLDLPGEARYPSVASVLGGTENPLRVTLHGGGHGVAVDAPPLVRARAVDARIAREHDTITTTVRAADVEIRTEPPVVVRGLRVVARASCPDGRAGATTIGSIQIGDDPPIALDARQNTTVPVGGFTLHVNEQDATAHGIVVRGLHLTGAGVDVTVGFARAAVSGCVGSGEPVASVPHDH